MSNNLFSLVSASETDHTTKRLLAICSTVQKVIDDAGSGSGQIPDLPALLHSISDAVNAQSSDEGISMKVVDHTSSGALAYQATESGRRYYYTMSEIAEDCDTHWQTVNYHKRSIVEANKRGENATMSCIKGHDVFWTSYGLGRLPRGAQKKSVSWG